MSKLQHVLSFLTPKERKKILSHKVDGFTTKITDENTLVFSRWVLMCFPEYVAYFREKFKISENGNILSGNSKNEMRPTVYFEKFNNIGYASKNGLNEIFGVINAMTGKEVVILKGDALYRGYKTATANVSSCMTNSKRIQFYVRNQKVVNLLAVQDIKTKKIYSRALLWKTNKGLCVDNIYTCNSAYMYMLKLIATVRYQYFLDDDFETGLEVKLSWYPQVEIKIEKIKRSFVNYAGFPYLDNFTALDVKKKILKTSGNSQDMSLDNDTEGAAEMLTEEIEEMMYKTNGD